MLSYGEPQKKIRKVSVDGLICFRRCISKQWTLSKIQTLTERMRRKIKDDRLLEGLLPKWGVGCRRIAPGDPCMKAYGYI